MDYGFIVMCLYVLVLMQGPKWPLFYSHIDPVWSLLIIETGCTLGRAPRTKETLPDIH